ncbi:hypothetical protein D9756_001746 [Leucocoprinus leucothites]|uniref:Cytochrome b561 domain-containing protein n=1 Tax=Leucocoprinus leucothites TaxID=201217 RepID=A0A8H5G4A7_9AGAR|nr:hypothetical protein D9756_001746 [Leucoagaricus leucothites]
MPSEASSNTPRTRLGGNSTEVDRERLLTSDNPDSGDHRYRDDSGPAQPGVEVLFSTNVEMGADEESQVKPEGRPGDGWARNLAFAGVGILAITTWFTILSNDPAHYGWFALHPPMQSLALCFFTYGVMTLQPTSQPKTKAAGFIRHQTAVFYFGFSIIFLGTLAAVIHKTIHDMNQFQTWHAKFGLLCIVWLVGQVFLGAGSVWNGGSLFGRGMKAKALWKYHRLSGYILFALMMFTAHLGGVWSGWAATFVSAPVGLVAYTVAPAAIVIGVWSRVRTSKMQFR